MQIWLKQATRLYPIIPITQKHKNQYQSWRSSYSSINFQQEHTMHHPITCAIQKCSFCELLQWTMSATVPTLSYIMCQNILPGHHHSSAATTFAIYAWNDLLVSTTADWTLVGHLLAKGTQCYRSSFQRMLQQHLQIRVHACSCFYWCISSLWDDYTSAIQFVFVLFMKTFALHFLSLLTLK